MKLHSFQGLNIGWITENNISLPSIGFESRFYSISTFFTCLENEVINDIGVCRSDFDSPDKAGDELERIFLNYCGYLRHVTSSPNEKIKLFEPKTKQEIDLQTGCYLYADFGSKFYSANNADVYFNNFKICNIHLYSYGFPVKRGNQTSEHYIRGEFFSNNRRFNEFGNCHYEKFSEFHEIIPKVVGRFKYFSEILLQLIK